jgi:hypothetical protein
MNAYRYGSGDPANMVDPSGLDDHLADGGDDDCWPQSSCDDDDFFGRLRGWLDDLEGERGSMIYNRLQNILARLAARRARMAAGQGGDVGNDNDPDPCKGSKKKTPECGGGTGPGGGNQTDMGGDGVRKAPKGGDPLDPIRHLPITCSSVPVHIIFTGDARLRHIARQGRNPPQGGIPGHPSGDDTATVIPSQFGAEDGTGLAGYADEVEGRLRVPYRPRRVFRGLGDVIGPASARISLPRQNPGRVLIELPVLQRPSFYGDQLIDIVTPLGLGCPASNR